jgi:type II secretory ATPase GspE/PulE/Tfp pilus assembly ATPase PilB-like protein
MKLSVPSWKSVIIRLHQTAPLDEPRLKRLEALLAKPRDLDEVVRALGVDRHSVLQSVADVENMPFLDLRDVTPAPDALQSIPEATARRLGCLPLFLNGRELTVAVAEADWSRLDPLREALAAFDVIVVLADPPELARMIELVYPSAAEAEVAAYLGQGDASLPRLRDLADKAPIVRMMEAILERAVRQGASDVHLEPRPDAAVVRFRVDGLLKEAFRFDIGLHEAMVSRLKVQANLNIADRHRPQDGRFSQPLQGRAVEVRLSTLRTSHGEKAVLRLLGQGGALATVDALGMPPEVLSRFEALLAQPYGMILVTGPTGSGKTSTLYAALRRLGDGAHNVVTLEDPVEVQLDGINQVPMRPEIDLTFATALRAVLRQDPDVVMVGEIRDKETAEIALRAALTGHQLLSTLHANDSAETITRLLDMGVAEAHLAPALLGVVAQRMVRRVCACHTYRQADAEECRLMGLDGLDEVPVPAPRGCLECAQTGYKGRLALFELLAIDGTIRGLIQRRASTDAIRQAGEANGTRSLWAAGVREVLTGHTTLEEIRRVVRQSL